MHIKVPILFDARIITEFTASDQRLLTHREPRVTTPPTKRGGTAPDPR